MGWDSTTDMTKEQKAEDEALQIIGKAKVHEGTLIVVASSLYNLMLDLQKGKKIESHLLQDFIKAALFMLHYADDCGQLEFWMDALKPEHTIERLRNTLPLMRAVAGKKAADWGEQLQKLIARVDDASK